MKYIIYLLISKINGLYLFLRHHDLCYLRNKFIFSRVIFDGGNKIKFSGSTIKNSLVSISGKNNFVVVDQAMITKSLIAVKGNNNYIKIEKNVILSAGNIIIRGSNCKITIDEGSMFGGVRIVNSGNDCDIVIGKYCLFSDNIEIWSSDTHHIYDKNNNCINKEKSIFVKDRVWVGSRAVILKGVTIGANSVVGMASVVTKDIDSNTVNAGTPARCIKIDTHWSLD